MTIDEAKSLARVIGYADSACSICVGNLVNKANQFFPQFRFTLTREERQDRLDWQDPDDEEPDGAKWLVVDVAERGP